MQASPAPPDGAAGAVSLRLADGVDASPRSDTGALLSLRVVDDADATVSGAADTAAPPHPPSPSAWRHDGPRATLTEMFARVPVAMDPAASCFSRLATFVGPAVLISVGYTDPGNWSTNLAAGASFGYAHFFVILVACVTAMFLQTLAVSLGIATGRDLAQACRDAYPRRVALGLWLTAEVAIAATDVAEVIGSAIAIKLLTSLPLAAGVAITLVDVLLFSLLKVPVLSGFLPSAIIFTDPDALYVAMGIFGATSRGVGKDDVSKAEAVRFFTYDTAIALSVAFVVNAAILIVSASAFYDSGNREVADLQTAYELLGPLLGSTAAPILFAVSLLAAGQNSTLTGVMAGQVVMEGFLQWRISPTLRRLVTRLITLVPVLLIALLVGDRGVNALLIVSQVTLSFQLPFALVPLVSLTSDARKMGALVNTTCAKVTGWGIAGIITTLNAYLIVSTAMGGVE